MTSLEISDLHVSLGGKKILAELTLTIPSGTYAAILGPSGCGKTTLLRTIAGLITPSSGAIRFGKQLVSVASLVLPPHKRNIGYVPQEGGLFPHLSVFENVAFSLEKKLPAKEISQRVEEMLTLVGLLGFERRKPDQLSGGQQTRVALARALAMAPAMVIMDEPFAALDQSLRTDLSAEVAALLKSTRTTTITVTHDREDALVSADYIALMQEGRVVQSGNPQEIYDKPLSIAAAESTGEILALPALRGRDGAYSFALSPRAVAKEDQSGSLLIRPEEIKLVSAENNPELPQAIIGKVYYYGHDALIDLFLDPSGEMLRSRVTGPVDLAPGQRVALAHIGPFRWVSNSSTHE
jgi:iron(III) transport system ATP-binding protein